ncbi:MAG TPA: hypothetical protein VIE65_10810, partial [Methylobacter sp.]
MNASSKQEIFSKAPKLKNDGASALRGLQDPSRPIRVIPHPCPAMTGKNSGLGVFRLSQCGGDQCAPDLLSFGPTLIGVGAVATHHGPRSDFSRWVFSTSSSAPDTHCCCTINGVRWLPARGVIMMVAHVTPGFKSRIKIYAAKLVDYSWDASLVITFLFGDIVLAMFIFALAINYKLINPPTLLCHYM